MPSRLIAACLFTATALFAQPGYVGTVGTTPKPKPDDYPAHTALGQADLAAEFMVHSFAGSKGMYYTQDYVVVEVAVFPAKGETPLVNPGQFTLRLNGKKDALLPQSPGMVASSLKYPDWTTHPQVAATAGTGNTDVVIGPPVPVARFPGDPTARRPLPQPRTPEPDPASQPPERAEDVVVAAALPTGDAKGPLSGYLYFPYSGKSKKLKSIELLYTGPLGTANLRLR